MYIFSAVTGLNDTLFESNTAGEGPAIMNQGTVEEMWGTTFNSNTLSCPEGYYGYDSTDGLTGQVRRGLHDHNLGQSWK